MIKIPLDLWKHTKVLVAMLDTNHKTFILEAIQEKLVRETAAMKKKENHT